jgi:hypothetical protein
MRRPCRIVTLGGAKAKYDQSNLRLQRQYSPAQTDIFDQRRQATDPTHILDIHQVLGDKCVFFLDGCSVAWV